MRELDTTKLPDVWRVLRRAASIMRGKPPKAALLHLALEQATAELGLSINELAWSRASVARSKALRFTQSTKGTDELEYKAQLLLLSHALRNPWSPRGRRTLMR